MQEFDETHIIVSTEDLEGFCKVSAMLVSFRLSCFVDRRLKNGRTLHSVQTHVEFQSVTDEIQ